MAGGSGSEDLAGEAEEEADRGGWWQGACDGCSGCGSCETPDCDLPCDCSLLLRLSTLLRLAAFLTPGRAGRRPVLALLGLYRRRLTRFTPRCPSTPSCSAYAVAAVQALGARRGLLAAARRVRDCGRPGR